VHSASVASMPTFEHTSATLAPSVRPDPNIVSVYDYGTDPDGETQYIVMEVVNGQDLAAILRERGRLSTDDAVQVAIAVASALEAAHRRGIVHRDVKPGNILITDDGDVKVTDFGIARAVSEASMTVTGTTLGSVHYFSPEQARGDEVTGASDVYALGIVLYEMLTGRRPFEGDSAAGVALKRLNEDPQPPSAYRPVPSGLSAIVMRALERDPARRFPDAGSFAEALRVWHKDPAAGAAGAAAAGAGAAGVAGASAGTRPEAPLPPSGEPTVYVPPPVARPSDRAPARSVNVNAARRPPPRPVPPLEAAVSANPAPRANRTRVDRPISGVNVRRCSSDRAPSYHHDMAARRGKSTGISEAPGGLEAEPRAHDIFHRPHVWRQLRVT